MRRTMMAAAALLAIFAPTMCQAAENGAGGVWLNLGGVSHHFTAARVNTP